MKRRSRSSNNYSSYDYEADDYGSSDGGKRKSSGKSSSASLFNYTSLAVLAGVFILGIGVGIAFSSGSTLSPSNVASNVAIDSKAPNADICLQNGASAMTMDTRLFVTLNPFNVYISQPIVTPGCVLRSANWAVLEQRKLVTPEQVRECRQRMNTFGFTGQLENNPQINCIYQNDAAKNLFLTQPGAGAPPPDTERF